MGFWKLAEEEPERLAVVDPSGREVTYGELFGGEQPPRARPARARPDARATAWPRCCPTASRCSPCTSRPCRPAGTSRRSTTTWSGPRSPTSCRTARPAPSSATSATATRAPRRRRRSRSPPERRFAVGDVAGFRPLRRPGRRVSPPIGPRSARPVPPMHYTSGTTGQPKGVRRRLSGADPDASAGAGGFLMRLFGTEAHDGNVHICGSPLYHTAVLAFASTSLHLGHPVVLMDRWSPEAMLRADRATPRHATATWCRRSSTGSSPSPTRCVHRYDVSSLRSMVHAAAPCPRGDQAADARLVGSGDLRVLRRHRGRRHRRDARSSGCRSRARSGCRGRARRSASSTTTATTQPAGEIGTVYLKLGQGDFEYFKDKGKTDANRLRRATSPSATSGTSTRTGSCSCATGRPT